MPLFIRNLYLKNLLALALFSVLVYGCKSNDSSEQTAEQAAPALVKSADFNADSAFAFIKKQVAFGPRVPNSKAHKAAGDYFISTLKQYGWQVTEQPFTDTTFDNTVVNARNIIASLNPTAAKRIMLAAHWDSRPFADQDSLNKTKPVPAANDGASGVAVLLEIARSISTQTSKLDIGVDLVLFDAEDWGSTDKPTNMEHSGFCLGSMYWSAHKHIPNYTAYFGVLLDMVGAKGATFYKEGNSTQLAPDVVKTVWSTASRLGYSNQFINSNGNAITDDHLPVNQIARIPMIDIIDTRPNSMLQSFFAEWHTTHDDLDVIDPQTLKAVGQTLMQVLYQEAADQAL